MRSMPGTATFTVIVLCFGLDQRCNGQSADDSAPGPGPPFDANGYQETVATVTSPSNATMAGVKVVPLTYNIAQPYRESYSPAPAPALGPGQAPEPAAGPVEPQPFFGRRLQQSNTEIRNRDFDTIFTAQLGATDQQRMQGPFTVRPDTGSAAWIMQSDPPVAGGYDVSNSGPPLAPVRFQYDGSANGRISTFTGNDYASSFSFEGNVPETPSTIAAGQFSDRTTYQAPPFGLQPGEGRPIDDMFRAGNLPRGVFTFALNDYNPVDYDNNGISPGGFLVFGDTTVPGVSDARINNEDAACYNADYSWRLQIASLTATADPESPNPNTVNFCEPTDTSQEGCNIQLDSGSFGITASAPAVRSIYDLLGLPANPNFPADQATYTGRADSYPEIDCAARTRAFPTLDYRFNDRVYSLSPNDYIYQFSSSKRTNQDPICLVVITPAATQSGFNAVLGDPFFNRFPPSFLSQGYVGGSTAPAACLHGTVPVIAQCRSITVPATQGCAAFISRTELLSGNTDANTINGKNVRAYRQTQPITPASTVYDIQPPPNQPDGETYRLEGPQSYTFTLSATTRYGTSSCTAVVTVVDAEPLDPARISCGNVPASGVIAIDPKTISPAINPSYTKANGCPAQTAVSGLTCKNCILGPLAQDLVSKCQSSIQNNQVIIDQKQLGRVQWTVTATDATGDTAKKTCAICTELAPVLIEKCPNPFLATSPCVLGQY